MTTSSSPSSDDPHLASNTRRPHTGDFARIPRTVERRLALYMLVLTGIYLIVELGFNARLLDVVGGLASHDEIERIEVFG